MRSAISLNVEASPENQKFCYITLPSSARGDLLFLIRDHSIDGNILTFNDLVNSLIKVPKEYWSARLFVCSTELLCDVIGDAVLNDKMLSLDADGYASKLKNEGVICLLAYFYGRINAFKLFDDAVATSEPSPQCDSGYIIKLSGDPAEINALTKKSGNLSADSAIIKRIVSIEDAGKCVLMTREGTTFNWDTISKFMKDETKDPDFYKAGTSRLGFLAKKAEGLVGCEQSAPDKSLKWW